MENNRNLSSKDDKLVTTVTNLFVHWNMSSLFSPEKCSNRNPELYEASFICKVIDGKMKAFNIDVNIPDYLILIIELCTNGNPGQSLMILSEILEKIPNLKRGYTICPMDFSMAYPNKFPIVSLYPEINCRLEDRWNAQKKKPDGILDTDNQCDYPEYWMKFFE